MGGIGSGRQSTTATVEQSLTLNVNKLTGVLRSPGSTGKVSWANGRSIGIAVGDDTVDDDDRAAALRLLFAVESDSITQLVSIEWQSMHLGGHRPWFDCPRCGDRCGTLHLPPNGYRFYCRDCHDLGYRSERTDPMTRARLRFEKLHARINGRRKHPCDYLVPPDKPDGMHQSTYESLCDDLQQAFDEWNGHYRERRQELM